MKFSKIPILLEQLSSENTSSFKPQNKNLVPVENIDTNISETPKSIVKYLESKQASTFFFPKFDEVFKMDEQINSFEELSIYQNVKLQPVGDYKDGWIKTQFYLELHKGTNMAQCYVVPVFEDEDYIEALEVYAAQYLIVKSKTY